MTTLCSPPSLEPHQADTALAAYLRSRPDGWPAPAAGQGAGDFFRGTFRPHIPKDDGTALVTGYYEPVIAARLQPDAEFSVPLYRLPADPSPSHDAISRGALAGQGLEIAWLADPVERFFLQVQGSGRLSLPGGQMLRLGYAGQNGHEYRSLGQAMVTMGLIPPDQISATTMRAWFRENPGRVQDILLLNQSWVYFRELTGLAPDQGPIGTPGVPLVPMVSLAIDPAHTPLGAPVMVETTIGGTDTRLLMVAQDTGGAIKGAQRADIFFGTGDDAGARAGRQKADGRLTVLLPEGP